MTKFEEEAIKEAMKSGMAMICYERGCGAPNIGLNLKLGRGVHNFPWLEFAKNWHTDAEFQELLNKYCNLNDNYEKEVVRSSKLESQINELKSQLQQQALPVVPEFVAEWIECVKGKNNNALALLDDDNMPDDVNEWLFFQRNDDNINLILRAWLDGYTVEKPQLFYIELPNVYGLSVSVFVSKVENGTILEFTKGKNYALAFTEQEIKSIDERYWQFAVPVEDGE